jgi:hypothetical protein
MLILITLQRCVLYIWPRRDCGFPGQTQSGLDLSGPSGGGRRVRVPGRQTARHHILSTKLLWRVRQRWCHDDRQLRPRVFLQNHPAGVAQVKQQACCIFRSERHAIYKEADLMQQ